MPEGAAGAGPPIRRERVVNAARRRGQLIDAALRSIARNGLAGTTLATVAAEAGLSQGVAVFYFRTKEGLLAAALARHYERYQANWEAALAEAAAAPGGGPAGRLAALVAADFAPGICGREAQIVWHAFWGAASARPLYAQISGRFDRARNAALQAQTAALLAELGRDRAEARVIAAGIEALADGFWLQIYLGTGIAEPAAALAATGRFLAALFPERAAAFSFG